MLYLTQDTTKDINATKNVIVWKDLYKRSLISLKEKGISFLLFSSSA